MAADLASAYYSDEPRKFTATAPGAEQCPASRPIAMAAPNNKRRSRVPEILVASTVGIGLIIEVARYAVDPDDGKSFVGFIVVYGWLAVFTLASKEFPRRRRTMLVLGAVPLFLLATASVVLSFPIYVLPAVVLSAAIASAKDFREA